ncbi:MAG: hypothetical protein IJJ43_06925 [Oscillospiraceae bacterium]|nr:hypothetical protein [Oscillospiraceae bacterium]
MISKIRFLMAHLAFSLYDSIIERRAAFRKAAEACKKSDGLFTSFNRRFFRETVVSRKNSLRSAKACWHRRLLAVIETRGGPCPLALPRGPVVLLFLLLGLACNLRAALRKAARCRCRFGRT